jgi:hypothetical protein
VVLDSVSGSEEALSGEVFSFALRPWVGVGTLSCVSGPLVVDEASPIRLDFPVRATRSTVPEVGGGTADDHTPLEEADVPGIKPCLPATLFFRRPTACGCCAPPRFAVGVVDLSTMASFILKNVAGVASRSNALQPIFSHHIAFSTTSPTHTFIFGQLRRFSSCLMESHMRLHRVL